MEEENLFKWSDNKCFNYKASPICQSLANSTTNTTPVLTTTTTTGAMSTSTNPATTTPFDYIELRGGNNISSGNVYALNKDGILGPVCDDIWYIEHARIVCRQLGFSPDNATPLYSSHFGYVGFDFAMDDVRCDGDEERLQDCEYNVYDN